ncbi:MAG: helix-turn-helix transcriptional regulator [Bacteroidota bacterium]
MIRPDCHPSISPREREVLHLIAHENTSSEIADILFISNHTAITHRKNLIEKLGARNTAGLVRRGFELGLLTVSTFKKVS